MAIQAQNLADLVLGTLRQLNRGRGRQIAQAFQKHTITRNFFRKDRIIIGDGYGIQESLLDKLDENSADHVALFSEDEISVPDHLTQLQVNWVHFKWKWAYEEREPAMNKGGSKIVNVVKARETATKVYGAQKLEEAGWGVPVSGANNLKPNGIPYNVVYNGTAGFNGGAPTGHTLVNNVNLTTSPTYKNYTDNYTNMVYSDAIRKLRTAHMKCQFESPVDAGEFAGPKGHRYRLYMDLETKHDFDDAAAGQNDQLGPDVAAMDGKTVFKQIQLEWVPYFDDNMASGSRPIYMIDHNAFYVAVLDGWFMKQIGPQRRAGQSTTWEVLTHLTYNYVLVDRRTCALIAISDPLA